VKTPSKTLGLVVSGVYTTEATSAGAAPPAVQHQQLVAEVADLDAHLEWLVVAARSDLLGSRMQWIWSRVLSSPIDIELHGCTLVIANFRRVPVINKVSTMRKFTAPLPGVLV